MVQVQLAGREQFSFVAEAMGGVRGARRVTKLYANENVVEVESPVVGRLLRRFASGRTSLVPTHLGRSGGWLVAGGDRDDLDTALGHASRFIVPTYASYRGERYPVLQAFAPGSAGAVVSPHGYYAIEGPDRFEQIVLSRLDLWLDLEDAKPSIQDVRQPTYRELYEAFTAALAAANWDEAERALAEMRQFNLATADNLAFLRVQFLAQQERWGDIWALDDYTNLADLFIPRPVRASLISAMYYVELAALETEGKFGDALQRFQGHRPRLGRLLETRQGLRELPIVHVFAYSAAASNELDSLELLEAEAPEENQQLFTYLRERVARHAVPPVIERTPYERYVRAMGDRDYDTAWIAAREIEDGTQRVALMAEVADGCGDAVMAGEVLQVYRALPAAAQQELVRDRRFARSLAWIEECVGPINGWILWFENFVENPGDVRLKAAFDQLRATTDERYWSEERLERLTEYIQKVAFDEIDVGSYTRKLIEYFITYFLNEDQFPRGDSTSGALYDALRDALLVTLKTNETTSRWLVRLSAAVLSEKPDELSRVCGEFARWFEDPRPALQYAVIDAFELLADFGAQGKELIGTYRAWVEAILRLPGEKDRLALEAWKQFGDWTGAGEDLEQRISEALAGAVEEDTDNPVAALPPGYTITIFTLQESGAKGARARLLKRNSGLDVRICTALHNTPQAEALARNSNMVVIVTACIKHGLTNGIDSAVTGAKVRPASCGRTSIVREIETSLREKP